MEHETNEGTALSFAEQKVFFEKVFSNEKLSRTQKCYLTFVYLTGARRNEALAVTTDDVDFENKILHLSGTKTDGSNREIPLFPLVEKLLRSMSVEKGSYFPISEKQADRAFNLCMKNCMICGTLLVQSKSVATRLMSRQFPYGWGIQRYIRR